jgi:hypothetical protein
MPIDDCRPGPSRTHVRGVTPETVMATRVLKAWPPTLTATMALGSAARAKGRAQ